MKTIFVTGADRGLGAGTVRALLKAGHRVFAGQFMPGWHELPELKAQFPDRLTIVPLDVGSTESVKAAAQAVALETDAIDVLINNVGIFIEKNNNMIRESPDYDVMMANFNINTLSAIRMTEALLPLMDKGQDKRLCYVSSEASSLATSYRVGLMGYCMSKCALNMAVSIMFNSLRPDGYTFRLYHPGFMKTYMLGKKDENAELEPDEAAAYAVAYYLCESGSVDESKLVLRDYKGREWPW
jgi:NAD(P)-dependent dehydrogenase (short-subunit alcohol dehydrogenase family)